VELKILGRSRKKTEAGLLKWKIKTDKLNLFNQFRQESPKRYLCSSIETNFSKKK